MKKLLFSASVILLTMATGAFAQTKMTSETARFGIKAGVNLSRYAFSGNGNDFESELKDYQKDNIGFNVTAYGDFGVANNFFIQPGISLQNKGTKFKRSENNQSVEITQNTMWVEVPVNAVFRIPTGDAGAVQISAGPYIGFGISGKNKVETTGIPDFDVDVDKFKYGNGEDDSLNGLDYGLNFGLGYRLSSGITLGANYGLGLSNLIPKDSRDNDSKITHRVLGFSVGYSF